MFKLRSAVLSILILVSLLLPNYALSTQVQDGSQQRKPETPTKAIPSPKVQPQKKGESTKPMPPPPPLEKPYDLSQEAFVIEQFKVGARFESDGTGLRDWRVRVKIQNDAGVRGFGQLAFPYSAGNEKLDIEMVTVRKPDGTVVTATAADVQDLTSPVSREAPVYTDLRTKHVTVPGLRPGDMLEYHVVWQVVTPLAQDNFWLEHNFLPKTTVVLDEQLEINIPAKCVVKLKVEPGADPSIKEMEGRRTYNWRRSNTKPETEDKAAAEKKDDADPDPKHPDVQLTTFQSWNDVGQWYAALERDRIIPNDQIKVAAEQQVRGLVDDKKKIEALYSFVSKNFRYVSLSFGQGRYQPHAAADVLANQYGDCKDKHTLLAAMLSTIGVHALPVLMNSSRKLDPALPSPAQFDHVISAVSFQNELFWLDTTTEVAPFRLLSPQLRDRQGLLISADGPARLETTPAEPPFRSMDFIETEGQVNELGKLTGHTHVRLRGDAEMYMRMIFRRTSRGDWKSLNYLLAELAGLKGAEITEIKPSDPANTDKPFELDYDFSSADFLDWSSKKQKVELPLASLYLKDISASKLESSKPIQLGVPIDIIHKLKLTIPAKYEARAPIAVNVARDYADYRSSYKLDGNVLTVERVLVLRQREIPATRTQDYIAFRASTTADESQTIAVETNDTGTPTIPETAKVDELFEAAETASDNQNYELAETLLRRVLEKEPKHKTVRRQLAWVLYAQLEYGKAIEVLREQIKINPFDDYCYNLMGQALWQQRKFQEAESAFRKQLEITPLSSDTRRNLGLMLIEWHKYKEAIPELEQAITLTEEEDADDLFIGLGRAYLNLGQIEKGTQALDKAIEIAPGPGTWNSVAYFLSLSKIELDKAQQYAESAVSAVSTDLRNAEIGRLTMENLDDVSLLGAYWDTLGWVHFQKGNIDLAEKYINASWTLQQYGEVGDHLGQILEKRGRKEEAIRAYAFADSAFRQVPESMINLSRLVEKDKLAAIISKAKEDAMQINTVPLGSLLKAQKDFLEAEFYVVLEPGASREAQVTSVKFIKGDEKIKPFAVSLKGAKFNLTFPDSTSTKVIRRGVLMCQPNEKGCSFLMANPGMVDAID